MKMEKFETKTKFCHYTSMESARKILSGGTFYLSKFNDMNDTRESDLHEAEKDKVFSLSLCHSESMSIPLFYLYGGIDGKGCRIQFTPSKLKALLEECSVHYVNKQNICLKKPISPNEYSIEYDWIHYIAGSGYNLYCGKECKRYGDFKAGLAALRKEGKHYFVKNPVWKYENEFRIIVRFKNDVKQSKVALKFDIADNERGISVVCGPEYDPSEIETPKTEFSEYGIKNIKPCVDYGIRMHLTEKYKRK